MAITDNLRMMVKVCRLYYEENLSQKEISALMGISRPQISRMLTCARSKNIVSIKINNPFEDYCAIIGLNQKDLENQGILA